MAYLNPSCRLLLCLLLLLLGAAAGAQNVERSKVTKVRKVALSFAEEPTTELLTLSISIDANRLFHPQTGWFNEGPGVDPNDWRKTGANYWTHDSYPAHAELLDANGNALFSSTVDFRLFGGMSRLHPQKSFSVSARKKYGQNRIRFPLFGADRPAEFKYLVARNAGSDWGRSYIRDALLTDLLDDPSWELDHQAARPARVYINGKYWGLYHLREKINPYFLAERYGIKNKDDIDLLEGREEVKHGSRKEYDRLISYVRRQDLSDPHLYAEVRRQLNVDNFQRLQIANAYFDNRDAGGNLRYWRNREDPNSRWKWIMYDVDQGFGLHSDTAYRRNTLEFFTDPAGPAWPNPPWSTLLHRELLENPDYRRTFVNRTLDYLQTDFVPEKVLATIDRHAAAIAGEIPRQAERWQVKAKYWPLHIDRLRAFGRERPKYFRMHLRNFFNGGEDRDLTVTVPKGGFVTLNDNISIEGRAYRGHYFQRYPVHLRAVADRGYRFEAWSDGVSTSERTVDLTEDRSYAFTPVFVPGIASATSPPAPAAAPTGNTTEGSVRLMEVTAEPTNRAGLKKSGLSTGEIVERLLVAILVFASIAVYGSIRRKPE